MSTFASHTAAISAGTLVPLLEFLQPRTKIEAKQPGQCHRKVRVAVGVHCKLAGLKPFLADDAFNGHARLALIEHEGLRMEDAPAVGGADVYLDWFYAVSPRLSRYSMGLREPREILIRFSLYQRM